MNSPLYLDYAEDAKAPEPETLENRGVSKGWKALGWTSIALSGVLVLGSISAYGYVRYLDHRITRVDIDEGVANAVPKLNEAVNILLLGSDSRQGKDNEKYGKSLAEETPRADTTILMHLSPGGGAVTGISFPRDLMVDIPACDTPDGGTSAPQTAMINSAFSIGGVECTWKTIQTITNIHIDHAAVVDFAGFKGVVDAIGGVQICLPNDVNDPQSKLNLKKGKHTVKGETALAYVRARHGLGDGSDLSRVKRQQQFLGSVAKKALSQGVLGNPGKLNGLLKSVTKTVEVDQDFTITAMADLGTKLKDVEVNKIRFVTVPYAAYAPDPNRVALAQPDANTFFSQIANDNEIEDMNQKAETVPAAQVKVKVLNGSGIEGAAARTGEALTAKEFQVLSVGNPKELPTETQILYGEGAEAAANTLAKQVSGAKPVASSKVAAGTVHLVLGPGWTGLVTKTKLPKKLDGEIKANDNICAKT
ncbi:LytR family transcriptional attenuator [Actinocorallia herbida]|uniref:LytR family transcriptional attenuator n=1 Tax=Actinocorallia herbida TaxID=58109 RepID=A0A3N1D923_9ACTN|nr:LCP family protein [Actinocorallia herbida]ROO90042.1 LytR family transcriptional attenuator [Actinocorallia herbida]